MRAWYRITQVWHNLTAEPLSDLAKAEVQAVLTSAEWQLFQRFSDSDQRHSYAVLKVLEDASHIHPALLKAALLHDIGKTCVSLSVADRSAAVLTGWLMPAQAAQWARGSAEGWQRPFVVKKMHPAWGSEMAAAAGSDSLTVQLILRHQDPLPDPLETEEDELLRWLQWADDLN